MTRDDQLVIPMSLPMGLSLRAVADETDTPTAGLVRTLIRKGLEHSPELKEKYDRRYTQFMAMNHLQLLQAKSNLQVTNPNIGNGQKSRSQ